jgi:DNA modification methylase
MNIEHWPVARLQAYGPNPRKNDHAVDQMAASIKEYGFKIPILALSNGEIVDGHLRWKGALKVGLAEVPVILCDEWSEAKVKAFRLLVNRSAAWADFDPELVTLELQDLKALDFDLNLTGFSAHEIDEYLFADPNSDEEEQVSESSGDPVTRPDDLWVLGSHRVLCGDATSAEAVARLLHTATAGLMVTYGVEYDPAWRQRAGLGRQRQSGAVANDNRIDWTAAYRLFTGNVAYVWHSGVHASEVIAGLEAAGFRIRAQIIWAKQHFAIGRGDYHWQHEPCWYAVRDGKSSGWSGGRRQSTLWEVPNLNPFGGSSEQATGHGTQKPVELMRRSILNNSVRGEAVYDPFLGFGTTLMAAEATERICYGLDIDPHYVDVIIRRWQQVTGKAAVLESDGRSFDETSIERTAVLTEVE